MSLIKNSLLEPIICIIGYIWIEREGFDMIINDLEVKALWIEAFTWEKENKNRGVRADLSKI